MIGDLRAAADPSGLWPSLSSLAIGSSPSAFERRLAADNGWSEAFAARVIGEYRRFIYLASIADFEVTPSRAVDAAWHLHLEDAADYRGTLCGRVLGRELRHLPGAGDPLEEERFQEQYRRTVALYESVFGAPPEDVWPRPADASKDRTEAEQRRRDRAWLAGFVVALIATLFAAALAPALAWIAFGLGLALLFGLAIDRVPPPHKHRRDGSCGGSCSTGYSASDGDCGSCGGGCGGD